MKFDQKILVIRFSSIGDIVLSTSPLRTIRKKYPKSQITFLTLNSYASLLEFHPDIDVLISIERNCSIFQLLKYSKLLAYNNYSIVYDLHNSMRSRLITLRCKNYVKRISKPRLNRFLLFYLFYNRFKNNFSVPLMYHLILKDFWNKKDKIPASVLKVTQNEKAKSYEKLKLYGITKDFLVIIPGAAWKQKSWNFNKYVELINLINLPVIILGLASDAICFEISKRTNNVLNLAGKTSLREAMAIIANAIYVIGSDTGLTHVAEALGKNVSMILGPTSYQTGANVILKKSNIIEKKVWCRPCSQNGKRKCYRSKQFCMDLITVDDVLNSMPILE